VSERPTPETDAEHAQFRMGGFTLDFCRKLERERDEAREEIAALKDRIKELEGQVSYARHERNKALNEIDGYKSTFDVRWQAQMRAVTRWQEETGKKEFWPGHEDLCLWLMRKLEASK
jgi:predicted  nucleic acid-binding Zn-ribbon protein